MKAFQSNHPNLPVSSVNFCDVFRDRDAVGMLPNGQLKSTKDLMSPQQLTKWFNYYRPSLNLMLGVLWTAFQFLPEVIHPGLLPDPSGTDFPDLFAVYPMKTDNIDILTTTYLNSLDHLEVMLIVDVTTGLLGLANKDYFHEVWLYIQRYFQMIDTPGLLKAMGQFEYNLLIRVMRTWVAENDPTWLQHYLIDHIIFFVMPSIIAAYIANGNLQEAETLIDNVMGIERVRTWMEQSEAHRIDYYGFAMFVAAYGTVDRDSVQEFLQTISQKPGVDVQEILDCKPSSDQDSKVNDIFRDVLGLTFHERGPSECQVVYMKFERVLEFSDGEIYLSTSEVPDE
ncbi:hypothetical protein H4R35_005677 [Dimargaris xerosporica]|nr:hypothetical protein H4R35_005677 [Dimargaris xerosporica]